MNIKEQLSEKLQDYIRENKSNPRRIAKMAGVSPHTITKAINCENITVEKLQRIIDATGIEITYPS